MVFRRLAAGGIALLFVLLNLLSQTCLFTKKKKKKKNIVATGNRFVTVIGAPTGPVFMASTAD